MSELSQQVRQERAELLLSESEQIVSEKEVNLAVDSLVKQITDALSQDYPIICCVMTGGLVLTGQLVTRLSFPLDLDYVDVSRYRDQDVGGRLVWRIQPQIDLTNRTVLLVDDILDGGETLAQVKEVFLHKGARAVYTAVLANKDIGQKKPIRADFVGLTLPDRFVFGYGMDAYGFWRNLSAIYAVPDKGCL